MKKTKKNMWEILIPTIHYGTDRPIKASFHKIWDKKVRDITKGLTIMPPVKGHWINAVDILFVERMIPVRIMCTKNQIKEILKMTKEYYSQEAVMYYKISDKVEIYS